MTWPRIEDENYIMTTACEKPAEDAFRIALCEMILWLEEDYKNATRRSVHVFISMPRS